MIIERVVHRLQDTSLHVRPLPPSMMQPLPHTSDNIAADSQLSSQPDGSSSGGAGVDSSHEQDPWLGASCTASANSARGDTSLSAPCLCWRKQGLRPASSYYTWDTFSQWAPGVNFESDILHYLGPWASAPIPSGYTFGVEIEVAVFPEPYRGSGSRGSLEGRLPPGWR
jgi:hypothetical protein